MEEPKNSMAWSLLDDNLTPLYLGNKTVGYGVLATANELYLNLSYTIYSRLL